MRMVAKLLELLREAFHWHVVRDTGEWVYEKNAVTGRRRARRRGEFYQPLDRAWLDGRD